MKYIVLGVLGFTFLLFVPQSFAYEVSVQTIDTPYEIVILDGDPEREQIILGNLANVPEMYEVTSDAPFELSVEIRAVPSTVMPPQFSGIVVKQKETLGVEEVARLKATESVWSVVTDRVTGLRYQAGPFFSQRVPAGTYRIEVSTPDNAGKYLLVIGNDTKKTGYAATVRAIATVYAFYGLSKLQMFSSPYVHYPIGSVVLLGLLGATWYWQRRRT